jgi:hypothetical protein
MTWFSSGAVHAGTIESGISSITSDLEIESDESPELIAALVQNAKAGCYAESALSQPMEIISTVQFNGKQLDYRSYPKRPPRRSTRVQTGEVP